LIREGPSRDGIVILGAGPAGLSAAYELARYGKRSIVLEQDSVAGGLARTSEYKGYLFDIGGHRFFTKVRLVEKMWKDVLGDDLLERPRLSRIYYRSKFFHYPLDPVNVIAGLGFLEVIRCGISFLRARAFPQKPEIDFETWISNRFGKRLFRTFFENYTVPRDRSGVGCAENPRVIARDPGAFGVPSPASGQNENPHARAAVLLSAPGARYDVDPRKGTG
jgi:glycine/D-amino acid oxidase-like deaminating enzyme